jgi:predicted transcriptional regulator
MKKKTPQQRFKLVAIRLPPDVKAELERLADLDGRSLSNLITRLAVARIRAEQHAKSVA